MIAFPFLSSAATSLGESSLVFWLNLVCPGSLKFLFLTLISLLQCSNAGFQPVEGEQHPQMKKKSLLAIRTSIQLQKPLVCLPSVYQELLRTFELQLTSQNRTNKQHHDEPGSQGIKVHDKYVVDK